MAVQFTHILSQPSVLEPDLSATVRSEATGRLRLKEGGAIPFTGGKFAPKMYHQHSGPNGQIRIFSERHFRLKGTHTVRNAVTPASIPWKRSPHAFTAMLQTV